MAELETEEVRRRGFLKYLAPLVISVWAVGFVSVVASYLKAPARGRGGFDILRVGKASELEPGQALLVRHGSSPFYVVRLPNDQIVAVSALCTHYRCVLNWKAESQTFVCPCHDGVFNAAGSVISGLPSRDLPVMRTEVRLGEILVHVGD